MLHTMEALLGLPPMNNNDAFAAVMAPLFTGVGDQPAFKADYRNRDNGTIYQANTPSSPMAKESSAAGLLGSRRRGQHDPQRDFVEGGQRRCSHARTAA